jgi:opacity protein-like surface antigen
MKLAILAAVAACAVAAPAFAQDDASLEARMARVEQQLAQPSAREIQSSVDAYLATAKQADASLVGGGGSAGYDGGFWIRGGSFLLKINLTIQTRYEAFRWDDESNEPSPGGDLSGFSLPRVTLKFSGDATCDIHYYAELEFGHAGNLFATQGPLTAPPATARSTAT